MKRDYKHYGMVSDEEIEEYAGVVDVLVASTAQIMEGVTPYKTIINQRIERKNLGRKKGNIPEYNSIFLHVAIWVIQRFEHTRTVKIVGGAHGLRLRRKER